MIEFILEIPFDLKIIILSVFTIAIIEYFKEDKWKEQQSKRNWKENYHPEGSIKQPTRI